MNYRALIFDDHEETRQMLCLSLTREDMKYLLSHIQLYAH
jgi:hypothetical protein